MIRLTLLLLIALPGQAGASGDPAVAWLGWGAIVSHVAALLFAILKKSPLRGRTVVTLVLVLVGCWLWLSGVSAAQYLRYSWLVILLPWLVLLVFYTLFRYPAGRTD
jgi:hypothetical protein